MTAPRAEDPWMRALLAHPHAILFTLGADGRVAWISPQVEAVLGWRPDELVGQALPALAEAGGDAGPREASLRAKDGRTVWLEVASQAVRGAGGAVAAVHGLALDASARRRAQEALERSRARMEDLLESASDVIYLHDLEGRFLSVNAAATRTYGYSRDEFLRMSIRDLVDPSHLPRAAEEMRLKVEGKKRRSAPYELLTRAKDGRAVWVEVSTSLAAPGGRPAAIQGVARDVTERKASESGLRLVQRLALAAGEAPDFTAALATALEGIVEATGCRRAEGWVPGEDGRLRLAASWPEERTLQEEKFHRLSLRADLGRDDGVAGRAWREGRAAWLPDLAHDPAFQRAASAQAAGLRSLLAVPVRAGGGEAVALLLLFAGGAQERPPAWTPLAESVASQLASLLAQRRGHDRLEREAVLLRLQMELAPVGILLVGREGGVLGANRRLLELCGVPAPPDLGGLDGSLLRRLADPAGFLRKARELYEASRSGPDEVRFGDRVLRRAVVDLAGPSGAMLGRAIYLRDVTGARRVEEALRGDARRPAGG